MIRNDFLRKVFSVRAAALSARLSSTNTSTNPNELNVVGNDDLEVFDEDHRLREEQIELKRNKSRLREQHRNMLYDKNPYLEPALWHHGTVKYMRRVYGRYGAASGVDPAICWPMKQELQERLEYERVAYPFTVPQMIEEAHRKRQEKHEKTMARQKDIVEKMAKLEGWKQDLFNRIAKKQNEAMDAKLKRERLVEEVKRHFGYTVDPRDDRFKEMLAKKEKEQKKADKEARKKAREEKIVEKLLTKKSKENQVVNSNEDSASEALEGSTEVDKK